MGEQSKIEWTDSTWNPWHGCIKVSPGCKNCYMYRDKERYGQDPYTPVKSKPGTFNSPLKWKEPRMVFTCSWSDFFIEQADEWRDEAWDVIRATPHHTYQILTKRPERIAKNLPSDWFENFRHVWLGISAENQDVLEERAFEILNIPTCASVFFISAEPLLEEIDIEEFLGGDKWFCSETPMNHHFDWVIVGGESGPGFRQINAEWARSIRDQCKEANVRFFMKQMSGHKTKMQPIPEDLQIQEMPQPHQRQVVSEAE